MPLGTGILVQTRKQWRDVLKRVSAHPIISCDVETLYLDWTKVSLVGFSLGWREGDTVMGAYVPTAHTTGEMQLKWHDVEKDLKKLLLSREAVVAHNAKFDHKMLVKLGIEVERWWDTMIAHWLLDTNGVGSYAAMLTGNGSHGLKDLSWYLLQDRMTELADIAPKDPDDPDLLRVDQVLLTVMADYAGDDAINTLLLYERFLKQLSAPGMERVKRLLEKVHNEFMLVLADMEMWGVELDTALLAGMRERIETELVTLERTLISLRQGEDFPEIRDADLVRKLAAGYEDLDRRFTLAVDDPQYPHVMKDRKATKALPVAWTERALLSKGMARKQLFAASGLAGHPIELKIRESNGQLRKLILKYPDLAHKVFNAASPKILNQLLFTEMRLPPIGEESKDGYYSTNEECLTAWANSGSEFCKHMIRHREVMKMYGTYLVGMVEGLAADGRVRTNYRQSGTRTGRLASADVNLQNIPTSKEFSIREAFVATGCKESKVTVFYADPDTQKPTHLRCDGPGGWWEIEDGRVTKWGGDNPPWVLGVADYNQLEIRLLAHCSNDPTLMKAVLAGEDTHALTARKIFDEIPNAMPLKEVKRKFGEHRARAKTVNFGVIYGQGPFSLSTQTGVSEDEAQDWIDGYFSLYPGVKKYIQNKHAFATLHGYVETAAGQRRHLPAAQLPQEKPNWGLIFGARRQAQNAGIQGLAANVCAIAMRNVRRALRGTTRHDVPFIPQSDLALATKRFLGGAKMLWGNVIRMLLQIHDELVWESHPAFANYALDTITAKMSSTMPLRVPLLVEAASGYDWASTKN